MHWQYDKNKITYFADTDFRGQRVRFGIRAEDRARHMYIIGKTGMGKSTLLENLAVQDIMSGEGMCFIDPHGGTAELLLKYVPKERINDVIYFAPFDIDFPVAMNVLEKADMAKRPLIASGLLGAFKKVWPDSFSARMEYMLSNTLLALLETPGATLLGVNRMLADKAYRDSVIANVTDTSVKAFWIDEFGKWTDKMVAEAVPAIQNKVGQFSANPLIRNILGQSESTFDIRWIMDNRKIFIVNLSKGRIGESNAALLGAMLVTKMYLAAMSRAEVGETELKKLPPFYLYVDEFQSFANESFADILSEARKYRLCLTVAHQYIEQMTEEVRAAVFGNVGTMISFRVGSTDAEVLEKEFAPVFTVDDFVSLGFAQIYLKLMINGASSAPFSATTRDKPPLPDHTYEQEVVDASRLQFARPRALVETSLDDWYKENSTSRAGVDNGAPQTKKFASGARPDRPARTGDTPAGAQRQQFSQGERRPERSDGPSSMRTGGVVGSTGLRDALARVGNKFPDRQSQNIQGGQAQSPQMPPASYAPQEHTGQAYGAPQAMWQQQQGTMVPQHHQVPPQPPYPYQYPPHPYAGGYPPVYPYGYPYPPQHPVYYPPHPYPPQQYPQYHPGVPMPSQGQAFPQQYPPAPPYGYHPQHPGYIPQGQAQEQQPVSARVPAQARPVQQEKKRDIEREQRVIPKESSVRQSEGRGAALPLAQKEGNLHHGDERAAQNSSRGEAQGVVEKKQRPEERKEKDGIELKKTLAKKDDQKGPTPEKLDALAAALAKLQQKTAETHMGAPDARPEEPPMIPKEVPLDVLKDVLKDDEV